MSSNLSSSSISFPTVTPSLVMRGAPKLLSRTTLRPFGPSVTFTALARVSTPCSILSRASPENFTSLAAISIHSVSDACIRILLCALCPPSRAPRQPPMSRKAAHDCRSGNHPHDVGLLHDQKILTFELDLGARPFAEQDPVPGFHIWLDNLSAL